MDSYPLDHDYHSGGDDPRFSVHTPAVANGLVYATPTYGLFALEPTTGEVVWHADPGYNFLGSVSATEDAIAVGTIDERIRLYDPQTREVFASVEDAMSWTAIGDDAIITRGRHHLTAIDLESGEELWRQYVGSHANGFPAIVDDTAYAHFSYRAHEKEEYANSIVAFDLADGSVEWTLELYDTSESGQLAVSDETLYLLDRGEMHALRELEDDEGSEPDDGDGGDGTDDTDGDDGVDDPDETDGDDC